MNLNQLPDILASIDLINRLEGAISTFINSDWRGAHRRHGLLGVLGELLSSLTGHNAPEMRAALMRADKRAERARYMAKDETPIVDVECIVQSLEQIEKQIETLKAMLANRNGQHETKGSA